MKKIILIFALTLSGLSNAASAQTWTRYDIFSGLPDGNVKVAIDANGNKWIGMLVNAGFGGVAKFNGTFTSYNSGLPDNNVFGITIDGSGVKWAATYGGLAQFNGVGWTAYTTSNSSLPDNVVSAITIDGSGNKWVATYGGGLAKFDDTNWTVYNRANSGISSDSVWCVTIDASGNKWIGTDRGVSEFDGTNWTNYNPSNSGLLSYAVTAIAIDASGNKWFGNRNSSNQGLVKFDGINWTLYNTSNSSLPNNKIECIIMDGSGNKLIGTTNGLAKFDGVKWTLYNSPVTADNDIQSVAIDASGNMWVGTAASLSKISVSLSVNEINAGNLISISPNPFSTSATLVIASATKQSLNNIKVVFYDVLGRRHEIASSAKSGIAMTANGTAEIKIDKGNLTEGMYFYDIRSENGMLGAGKIIIE